MSSTLEQKKPDSDIDIKGAMTPAYDLILNRTARAFLAALADRFTPEITALLARRQQRQAQFDAGEFPDFLPETQHIRDGEWTVATIPATDPVR